MGSLMCPGQDMRFWKPGDIAEIECGNCGAMLEFFKDESRRRCRKCGNVVTNPKISMGCAQWCEHAKECLGFDPKEAMDADGQVESITERLIAAMKGVFKGDGKRVSHALAVLEEAEKILRGEEADPKVVLAAAILHDIGIHEAEKKHGSSAGVYQEMEGPAIAEPIMKDIGLDNDTIDHVLKIIANHHSAKDIDTPEFRIIWDSDWIVNIPDEYPDLSGDELKAKIDKVMRTETGRKVAYETLMNRVQRRMEEAV